MVAVLLLVILYLAKGHYCAEYYVKPDSFTRCPNAQHSCLTLSEYLQNFTTYISSRSTFTLLQGEHHLNEILILSDVTGITFRGEDRELATISIDEGNFLMMSNSQEIEISSLVIVYHGGTNTSHTALIVEHSTVQVSNVQFTGENRKSIYSQGITLVQSTATFINCSFMNWHGIDEGAVYVNESNVTFSDTNTFKYNTARRVIYHNKGNIISETIFGVSCVSSIRSSILFNGSNTFEENQDTCLKNLNTTLKFLNEALFSENYGDGSVIYGWKSDVLLDGWITFRNNNYNIAFSNLIEMYSTNFTCNGEVTFLNTQSYDSTVKLDDCRVSFYGEINFINNNIAVGFFECGGGALCAEKSSIHFVGSINFVNNSAKEGNGGGVFIKDSILESSGNIIFANNHARSGGGMYAINSTINFTGSYTFQGNTALNGGGMVLKEENKVGYTPQMVLHSPVTINFVKNRAITNGGGLLLLNKDCIYINDKSCFFTIEAQSFYPFPDVHLNIKENYAEQYGTGLYGGSWRCYNWNGYQHNDPLFKISNSTDNVAVSSAIDVCFCYNDIPNCSRDHKINVSRGEYFNLSVAAVGQGIIPVPATIRAYIRNYEKGTRLNPQSFIVKGHCTNITIQLFTAQKNVTLILYLDTSCTEKDYSQARSLVTLTPCPLGFNLTGNHCACERRLSQLTIIKCYDDMLMIKRLRNSWIDEIWDENMSAIVNFVYHSNCPPNYCKPANETIYLSFSFHDSNICSPNRSGLLCGACKEGLSLTLNNFNCKKCDNRYITLLLFFAFAGIAVIVVLLSLHMTVASGTINGLILYANIVNVSSINFIPSDTTNILTIFIAWLNLDFGISTCFYDGLNFYSYAWLEYIFPLYLWFLIGVIIISSRVSSKVGKLLGSNPVAVLATVILMSYTKLFQATIVSLTPTFLYYSDGHRTTMWLYDANIPYFGSRHFFLGVTALCTIFFLLLPYTFLLLFGYRLIAFSARRVFSWLNKIKPLLDAYYAPYKAKTRYWPGLMLLVRSCLYLAFSVTTLNNPSANLVAISCVFTAVALMPWLGLRVYEKLYNDILEASFILNICILSVATYHVKYAIGNEMRVDVNQKIVTSLSISVALLQFIGIVCFHLYLHFKTTTVFVFLTSRLVKKPLSHSKENQAQLPPLQQEVTMTVMDLREPLIDSQQ